MVAQPGSLKQSVNLTCSSLTTCLDKRSLSNLTQARRQQNRIWIAREEKKKNPTQLASTSTSEGEGDKHPAVRTRTEKRQKKEDERPKHHAVRANKYGQAGLKPGHPDTFADGQHQHLPRQQSTQLNIWLTNSRGLHSGPVNEDDWVWLPFSQPKSKPRASLFSKLLSIFPIVFKLSSFNQNNINVSEIASHEICSAYASFCEFLFASSFQYSTYRL